MNSGSSTPAQDGYATTASRSSYQRPSIIGASSSSENQPSNRTAHHNLNADGNTTSIYHFKDNRATISRGTSRPATRNRLRCPPSTIGGGESQQIICAVSEARGVSPTVGVSFVNISTGEAVISQICDNQFYARTLHKMQVFEPSEILISSSCVPPNSATNLYSLIEENVIGARLIPLERGYWNEIAGHNYISQLAFIEDIEAIKVAIGGNYFAICCLAAVGQYHNPGTRNI